MKFASLPLVEYAYEYLKVVAAAAVAEQPVNLSCHFDALGMWMPNLRIKKQTVKLIN